MEMNATDSLLHAVHFQIAVNDAICENLLIRGSCHQLVLGACTNVWLKMASFARASQMDLANCPQKLVLNV
uniref:Uncharacterized protein n=1 Tax=Arundo donax TaxID=35708 RepID=A0A0A9D2Q4_ARUDO